MSRPFPTHQLANVTSDFQFTGVEGAGPDLLDLPLPFRQELPGRLLIVAPGRPAHHLAGVVPVPGGVRPGFSQDPVGPVLAGGQRGRPGVGDRRKDRKTSGTGPGRCERQAWPSPSGVVDEC